MVDGQVACELFPIRILRRNTNARLTIHQLLDLDRFAADRLQHIVVSQIAFVQTAADEMVQQQFDARFAGQHFVGQAIEAEPLEGLVGGHEKRIVGAGHVLCDFRGVEESASDALLYYRFEN